MAEGFLKSFDNKINVVSAGTMPSSEVHPLAIKVMAEKSIDLSDSKPESVEVYLNQTFDYVISVCGGAKEACPAFVGEVKHRIHIGFDDPADATGTDGFVLSEFRRIRDEIELGFFKFYEENIQNK
jgi:arsenate reductase